VIKQAEWFAEMTRGYDRDPEYQAEYLKLVFGEELGKLMDQQSISQADLARRIGSSRAYVTRIFRSNFNPTFETVAKLAIALNGRISLHLHPIETEVRWLEIPQPAESLILQDWHSGTKAVSLEKIIARQRGNESAAAA
jgi:transcriptional regulator with XRE-family HTH domain